MSLTSYRAAPPRANHAPRRVWPVCDVSPERERGAQDIWRAAIGFRREDGLSFAGPATTYSPGP
jgi:hypothetical protein